MNEYHPAPEEDVVVSARVRLARNYRDLPFPVMLNREFADESIRRAVAALPGTLYRLVRVGELPAQEKQYLCEQRFISPEMGELSAALISVGHTVSVLINEEDHLRIQAMLPGSQLDRACELAFECDNALSKGASFAFDRQMGYLTSCPTNVGTGLRASLLLHLPALAAANQIAAVVQAAGKVSLNLRPQSNDAAAQTAKLYLLSNQNTLGRTEEDLLHTINDAASEIVAQERMLRKSIFDRDPLAVTDRLMRSAGLLSQSRLVGNKEWTGRYSDLRYALSLGLIRAAYGELDDLKRDLQPASLSKRAGHDLPGRESDALRAEILRTAIRGMIA